MNDVISRMQHLHRIHYVPFMSTYIIIFKNKKEAFCCTRIGITAKQHESKKSKTLRQMLYIISKSSGLQYPINTTVFEVYLGAMY